MPTLRLGDITIDWLSDGDFVLDGGAMFGVVPKVVWSKKYPVDADNMIPQAARPLLITAHGKRILVETGLGTKLSEKEIKNFKLRRPPSLVSSLAERGLSPEDIDIVLFTHLHFDHAGGATYRDEAGVLRPTFPRARHVMSSQELEVASHPDQVTRHMYLPDNVVPLVDAGLADPVGSETELVPGIRLIPAFGHTVAHLIVRIDGGGQTALHMGDFLPTSAHLNPYWVMAYDISRPDSIARKFEWIPRAEAEGWWLTFYHDPFLYAGKFDPEGKLIEAVRPESPVGLAAGS